MQPSPSITGVTTEPQRQSCLYTTQHSRKSQYLHSTCIHHITTPQTIVFLPSKMSMTAEAQPQAMALSSRLLYRDDL